METKTTIKRVSMITGRESELVLPMTPEAFEQAYAEWTEGKLIQNAFPMLTPAQREFIMTGITSEEWNNTFGEDALTAEDRKN